MALFVVIAPFTAAGVRASLQAQFSFDHFEVSADTFLVSAQGLTTRDLSDRLGITSSEGRGPNATAVVLGLNGTYYGNFNPQVWEWLRVKIDARGV